MRGYFGRLSCACGLAVTLSMVSLAWGPRQDPGAAAQPKPAAADDKKPAARPKGGLRAGGGAPPKTLAFKPGDPLAKAAGLPLQPAWPYHFSLKLTGTEGVSLAARYYPSRAGESAPVILFVHATGTGHSGRDFEEPIEGLDPAAGLAQFLQEEDYAALVLDLRGHGKSSVKRELVRLDWTTLASDLRAAYLFLIDRNNRQELNLAKLVLIAADDGGVLAVNWARASNGPVSGAGRPADMAAIVMVSPPTEANGLDLTSPMSRMARVLPMLLIGGERDAERLRAMQAIVERNPSGEIRLVDSRLQGDRLIQYAPEVSDLIAKFLEQPAKFRASTPWEPRYLLNPVVVTEAAFVDGTKPPAAAGAQPAAVPAPKAAQPANPAPAQPPVADPPPADAAKK